MEKEVQIIIDNLKRFRKKHGFTQKQVAEGIGVPQSHYSVLENSATPPSIGTIIKLSRFYQIEPYLFLKDPDITQMGLEQKLKELEELPDEERATIEKVVEMSLERNSLRIKKHHQGKP